MSRTCLSSMAFLVIAASLVVGVPRTPYKSKHKHFRLNINDNELSDIRSAFDSFRDADSKRLSDDSSTDIAKDDANSDNDAIDNHLRRESFHHSQMSSSVHHSQDNAHETFNRRHHHHRHHHHTTLRTTTTTAPTTAAVKSYRPSSNDDDEDDYFDAPPSRHHGDSTSSNRSNRVIRHDHHQQPSGSESLTDLKWKTLSTRDGVEESFRQYIEENPKEKEKLVLQHVKRFRIDAKCQWPSRRVIDAPSPAYTPRKYLVFKCSDDTACCHSQEETCVAKNSKFVDLWFRVNQGTVKLTVRNDTECHCVKIEKLNRAKNLNLPNVKRPPPRCKCPSNFIAQIDADGCNCNCFDSNDECWLRYEGKEGFTLSDQRCIQQSDCTTPHCQHGMFSTMKGRCPDEHDKFTSSFTRTRRSR